MFKKCNLTFDLGWPWPWLILCTRVSYNQYMLKYGQKMSIWPLTLSDLGWPWPWPWLILCTRVSFNQYMLKYGQKCQFDLWPWVTLDDLDLDLDLFCAPGCHIINICWNMVKKCQFDLWPWAGLPTPRSSIVYNPLWFCVQSHIFVYKPWKFCVQLYFCVYNCTFFFAYNGLYNCFWYQVNVHNIRVMLDVNVHNLSLFDFKYCKICNLATDWCMFDHLSITTNPATMTITSNIPGPEWEN